VRADRAVLRRRGVWDASRTRAQVDISFDELGSPGEVAI